MSPASAGLFLLNTYSKPRAKSQSRSFIKLLFSFKY